MSSLYQITTVNMREGIENDCNISHCYGGEGGVCAYIPISPRAWWCCIAGARACYRSGEPCPSNGILDPDQLRCGTNDSEWCCMRNLEICPGSTSTDHGLCEPTNFPNPAFYGPLWGPFARTSTVSSTSTSASTPIITTTTPSPASPISAPTSPPTTNPIVPSTSAAPLPQTSHPSNIATGLGTGAVAIFAATAAAGYFLWRRYKRTKAIDSRSSLLAVELSTDIAREEMAADKMLVEMPTEREVVEMAAEDNSGRQNSVDVHELDAGDG